MAKFRSLSDAIQAAIKKSGTPAPDVPTASSLSVQMGSNVPPAHPATVPTANGIFVFGFSTFGLASITGVYKPEQPVEGTSGNGGGLPT